MSLGVSGIDLKIGPDELVTSIKVAGEPMDLSRTYSLALSEGFAFAVSTRPGIENLLCVQMHDTGILMRDALLEKVEKLGTLSPQTLGPLRVHKH